MSVPYYDIDFYGDEFIRDPFPHYAKMRELGPVVWLPQLENFALPRYKEVQRALRDNDTFISSKGVAGDQFGCDFLQGNTVASDEPRHSELRQAMAPPLLPGALEAASVHIEETADELVQSLKGFGEFDAIEKLARHLPLTVVRDLVGLPDFAQDKMLKWAGAAFDVLGMQNERGKAALEPIQEMRDFIENDATPENLKPGSWTNRINTLVDQGVLPCEHAAFAMRDYINPSLDTTISATGELIYQLGKNPDQFELLRDKPEFIKNAVNEAVRLSTPIRSFSRHASRDVEIEGHLIPEGSRVMMLFASANRDGLQFPDPDKFDARRPPNQHLGFGSGIHMCVGMHLAQLEMEAIAKSLLKHVDAMEVGKPDIALNNTIRGYRNLPCKLKFRAKPASITLLDVKQPVQSKLLDCKVESRKEIATDIVELELVSNDENKLPKSEAGSHIDIHIAPGLVRQYSLTGKIETGRYRIAIQKEPDSKGGSTAVHERMKTGSQISVGRPRNNFKLDTTDNPALLVAGGIGITPLVSMAWELHARGQEFQFLIFARSKDRIAYKEMLDDAPFCERVHVACDDDANAIKLDEVEAFVSQLGNNTHIYTCGPKGFMNAVAEQAEACNLTKSQFHLEHFSAEIDCDGAPFTVHAKRSNQRLKVPAGKTIFNVLNDAGIEVETSCQNGVCGSCLTTVLEGTPDHRDMVQTDEEKASNEKIAVCCSRSKSKVLVLDI